MTGVRSSADDGSFSVIVPTDTAMHELGICVAGFLRSGDVVLLSGPLGAGKTTFAQGVGTGLHVDGPVVSPTFTIARELKGRFSTGDPARLVHVDAYRIGGVDAVDALADADPAQAQARLSALHDRLLDELESLGLDEELDSPSEGTVVLMEWGEQMAGVLADSRLELAIARPVPRSSSDALTADGERIVKFTAIGRRWTAAIAALKAVCKAIPSVKNARADAVAERSAAD